MSWCILYRCPCMILHRSLWEDRVAILLKAASRVPCIKILTMLCIGTCMKFFWDAHRKFLYKTFLCRPFETLWDVLVWGFGMRSWWVDTALLLVLVILFHSYCCLYWYIDFLPPKLFGVSCRCIFLWGVIPTQNSIFEASNFQVIN